jgi:hypothetical protein
MQALGQWQAGRAQAEEAQGQAAVAAYNARVQEQEAAAIEAQTAFKQKRQAEEAGRYASTLRANLGASGVVPGEGTPLLIEARQAAEAELDQLMIGYQGQIGAARARSAGAVDMMQADIYRRKARNYGTAGAIGAGTTLLTGFAKAWE